ncbi:MAG: DJ-1/PfpI/YhbO family deglycase/protease [Planctomycetes bacterium]|jgi:protease I|nr:DJ-1/PfpI/YhbO family deglycase/protease [Planctomycetota bacterium]
MDLTGRRIAIMIDNEYQELEVWYPYYRFLEAGAKVDLVGPEAGAVYPSKLGYPCQSTATVTDVKATDYDAVVIPGGWCPDYMRRSEMMVRFVQDAADNDVLLAAICHGGWMLASTDVLKGKRATSFMAIRHDMANAGAEWVDEEVVVDGTVITARKPDDLPAFCVAIGDVLTR